MRLPLLLAVPLLLLALAVCPAAQAQEPADVLVGSWLEPVKLEDGSEETHRYEITFDVVANEAVLTIYGEDGSMIESRRTDPPATPHPDEEARGLALIHADRELASVIASIEDPVVEGGFVLYEGECREVRCLQFTIAPADASRLERFVVVDLSTGTILDRDRLPNLRD